MVEDDDREWLRRRFPGLSAESERVWGALRVEATYNAKTGRFLALAADAENTVGGVALSGNFTIKMRQRDDRTLSRLPALWVQGVEPIPERHFSQTDRTACLCSPFEEDEFLIPAFQFRKYFEELVIPFLYGQLFYSKHGYWPWSEYAHGATGLLQSYARVDDPSKAKDCIEKLSRDAGWPNIRAVLAQGTRINGHVRCFCSKKDFMKRCHPAALKGLRMLRNDASKQGLYLPSDLASRRELTLPLFPNDGLHDLSQTAGWKASTRDPSCARPKKV